MVYLRIYNHKTCCVNFVFVSEELEADLAGSEKNPEEKKIGSVEKEKDPGEKKKEPGEKEKEPGEKENGEKSAPLVEKKVDGSNGP